MTRVGCHARNFLLSIQVVGSIVLIFTTRLDSRLKVAGMTAPHSTINKNTKIYSRLSPCNPLLIHGAVHDLRKLAPQRYFVLVNHHSSLNFIEFLKKFETVL